MSLSLAASTRVKPVNSAAGTVAARNNNRTGSTLRMEGLLAHQCARPGRLAAMMPAAAVL